MPALGPQHGSNHRVPFFPPAFPYLLLNLPCSRKQESQLRHLSWRENTFPHVSILPKASQLDSGCKPRVGNNREGKASVPAVGLAPVNYLCYHQGMYGQIVPHSHLPPHTGPRPSATQPPTAGAVYAPHLPPRHHPPGSSSPQATFLLPEAPHPHLFCRPPSVFSLRAASPPVEGAFLPQPSPGNQLRGGGAPFESLRSHPLPPHALNDWWMPASPRPPEAGRRRGSRPEVCRWGIEESRSEKDSIRRAKAGRPRARARAREILLGFPPAAWTSRRRARERPNERGPRALSHSLLRPLLLHRLRAELLSGEINTLLGEIRFLRLTPFGSAV